VSIGTGQDGPITAAQLGYGVEPRSRQWWRWARFGLAGLLLVAAAWGAIRVRRAFAVQSAHLQAQAALFRQVLPEGTVLYTEDPTRIETVRGRGGYRDARNSRQHRAEDVAVMPGAWERVERRWDFEGHDEDNPQIVSFQLDDTFNHLRTSKGGVRWIVSVGRGGPFATPTGGRTVGIAYGTFSLAGWKPGDRGFSRSTSMDQVLLGRSDVFTLFAPQPDPNDASLVMAPYELNGQPGILDAQVTDEGYLICTVRTGPAHLTHPGQD
jgi:hypothetical protein